MALQAERILQIAQEMVTLQRRMAFLERELASLMAQASETSQPKKGRGRPHGAASGGGKSIAGRILEVLGAANGEAVTVTQLVEANVGKPRKTVSATLSKLASDPALKIERVDKGLYRMRA